MVTRAAIDAAALPRIAVASDGTLAAIHEASRIVVIELPGCAPFAEIGIDREAEGAEVAWLGAPPRLVVLARHAAHTRVHLIDPYGPRTVAEIRLEAPMRLYAAVGAHALAVGSLGAAVLTAGEAHLTPYQFPTRAVPIAAGAAGSQFVIALAGSIEEWDPQTRMPRRKLKLPRTAPITAVGGSDRVVWLVTQAAPNRVEVLPLVHRGQPKGHELPEPIAHVASHPRSDLIACIGAESGRLYVIDLDGRAGLRVIGPERIDQVEAAGVVVGRTSGVIAAQTGRPVALVALDGREAAPPVPSSMPPSLAVREPEPETDRTRSTLYDDPPAAARTAAPVAASPAAVAPASSPSASSVAPASSSRPVAVVTPPPPVAAPSPRPAPTAPPTHVTGAALSQRFSSWRERLAGTDPRVAAARAPATASAAAPVSAAASPELVSPAPEAAAPPPTPALAAVELPATPAVPEPAPVPPLDDGWRDDLVAWTRAVQGDAPGHALPDAPPIAVLARRFALAPSLVPALALIYGAHLAGEPGAAPVDVARVLGGRWDEALGAGALAGSGVVVNRDSRVRLAPAVQRALDGLPPRTGVLVGAGEAALPGPRAFASTQPPHAAALAACAATGGAILVAHDHADAHELVLEARARGAIALLLASGHPAPDEPALVLVASAREADALGIPLL